MQWCWLLQFYLFRVGDTVLPLLFMNPCNLDLGFQLNTDRHVVINYKSSPHNKNVVRWLERLEAANGGRPLQSKGDQICEEVNKNFPYLNQSHLRAIHECYRARYYFVDRERPRLKPMLVFQKGKWHIYDLAQIPSS